MLPRLVALACCLVLAGCAAPTEPRTNGTGGTGGPPGAGGPPSNDTGGPSPGPHFPVWFHEGFETEPFLAGWANGTDLPEDPNRTGTRVAWNITRTAEHPFAGNFSARVRLDGRQDDGTVWIQRAVQAQPETAYRAELKVAAWSASESFNHLADLVMSLGPAPPTSEADFTAEDPGERNQEPTRGGAQAALREPLDQRGGWRTYTLAWDVPPSPDGRVWIAVGISVVWETEVAYDLDDITLSLHAVEAVP